MLDVLLTLYVLFYLIPAATFTTNRAGEGIRARRRLIGTLTSDDTSVVALGGSVTVNAALAILHGIALSLGNCILGVANDNDIVVLSGGDNVANSLALVSDGPATRRGFGIGNTRP